MLGRIIVVVALGLAVVTVVAELLMMASTALQKAFVPIVVLWLLLWVTIRMARSLFQ